MTKLEILDLAESLDLCVDATHATSVWEFDKLVAFAKAVAAAERERCAKMCEAYAAEGIGREMADALRRMG